MGGWDELLDRLAESPRENGTAAVHETARFLADALAEAGVAVERVAFTAQPYGLRLAGVAVLAGGLWYLREVRQSQDEVIFGIKRLKKTNRLDQRQSDRESCRRHRLDVCHDGRRFVIVGAGGTIVVGR